MPPSDDGDIIRGLGFVALYAAYLEEQVDNLLIMLEPLKASPELKHHWPVSRKIDKSKSLVRTLEFDYREFLLESLNYSKSLFEKRNEVIHGRIYASFDRSDTLKSGRTNVPNREISSNELYELVTNLANAREKIYRPMIFQIPQAIKAHQ
ncbi:MAG: hypothetical protein KBF68_00330 [Nitrosomonas sp.]|jgi:hypothetical protein|nr:hypothetical protein [Nitrosomonas sp.]MBP9099829.1 hypothetical protein [Nitrosomonas sp.]